jgi:hypothetical protein
MSGTFIIWVKHGKRESADKLLEIINECVVNYCKSLPHEK